MEQWHIRRYSPEQRQLWDEMVDSSRNGTFLFHRAYMDYHSDRFRDHSLMAWRGNRLVALLPACERGGVLASHPGLTYGGWILGDKDTDGASVMALFEAMIEYACGECITRIDYKPLPYIYARRPSQEDIYALWRMGARTSRCLLSSAIDLRDDAGFDYMRRRYLRRVEAEGVYVCASDDLRGYWRLLEECLDRRYGARPVHTADEICALHDMFPDNIRLHLVCDGEGMQGGVLIYDTGIVVHCQYICSSIKARRQRYMPYLFSHLIRDTYSGRRYFDFGTSNEDNGRLLNADLLRNKYGYGGRGVAYQEYSIDIR